MNEYVEKPIYALAITWILLLPLLFFVARGTFSFDRTQSGNFTASEESALNSEGAGSTWYRVEQVFIYAIVLAAVLPASPWLFNACRQNALVFVLPIWSLASTLWTQSVSKTILMAAFAIILTLFGVYLAERFSPQKQVRLFFFVGGIAIFLSIAAAVFYPAAGVALSYGGNAWRGIWIQKNHCGMIACLLAYAGFCMESKSVLQRLGSVLFVLLATLLVIMSQSRTAWIMFALSLLAVALINVLPKFRRIEAVLFGVCLAFVVTAGLILSYVYAAQISVALGKDPSASGRAQIFHVIYGELWKRPLFGFGYRAFFQGLTGESGYLSMALGSTTVLTNAENAVLEIWLEMGLIGVFLMLLTLFEASRNAITCLAHNPPKYIRWYALIVFFNILSLGDGDKIMFPHTIEWLLLVVAYVGLATDARRIRSQRAA